jgi:hypothetical protein
MSEAPYVKVPLWVYRALEDGRITRDQFDLLTFAYYKADWMTRVVSSYSAENLCRFLRLDATDANLKRFQRAERDLEEQGVIWDDYRRMKANSGRPFSLRLPPVDTENIESLFKKALVAGSVAGSVAPTTDTTHTESKSYCEDNPMDAAVGVAGNGNMMSSNDQGGSSHTEEPEKNPLNPLRGLLPRSAPPQGGDAQAAGLKTFTGRATSKSLSAEQCEMLNRAVLHFGGAVFSLYHFTPDVKHSWSILRKYSPDELLYALIDSFPVESSFQKTSLAYFFRTSAVTHIELRRSQGISLTEPLHPLNAHGIKFPDDDKQRFFHNDNIEKCRELWNQIQSVTKLKTIAEMTSQQKQKELDRQFALAAAAKKARAAAAAISAEQEKAVRAADQEKELQAIKSREDAKAKREQENADYARRCEEDRSERRKGEHDVHRDTQDA